MYHFICKGDSVHLQPRGAGHYSVCYDTHDPVLIKVGGIHVSSPLLPGRLTGRQLW